jgi:hypothetical protein
MTRKRKNAGEGYGYMFSGAFAKKSDAVKKEATRKGSFIKGIYVQGQHRYAVMTPRTNPIKRKSGLSKADLKVLRAAKKAGAATSPLISGKALEWWEKNVRPNNPAELVVLGANPHENREISLPAGSTLTIRVNPAQLNPICGAIIGGEPCSRQPGHRGPHLPQGATMRPRSRLRSGWKPRGANPSAAAIRESFTGRDADKVSIRTEPHVPAGDYAQLGELLALYIKPDAGGQVQQIQFSKPRPLVVSDETARQLYFVGGDQDIGNDLSIFGTHQRGGLLILGGARRIDYKQRKEHVPDPSNDEWRHEFGEDSGVHPTVLYDRHNKTLLLEGGEYTVRPEGIVN